MASDNLVAFYIIKGIISELPKDQQDEIYNIVTELKGILQSAGDAGTIAISLLAAELTAKD